MKRSITLINITDLLDARIISFGVSPSDDDRNIRGIVVLMNLFVKAHSNSVHAKLIAGDK